MSTNVALYAALLKSVAYRAKTIAEIAGKLGFQVRSCRLLMARMHTLDLVHIAGWAESKKGPMSACWRLGNRPDASRPVCGNGTVLPPREKRPLRPRVVGAETLHFAALIRALAEPISVDGIRAVTGRQPSTIYRNLRALRTAGLAHIFEWDREKQAGDFTPLWAACLDKADAPRPRAYTARELRLRYHQGRKQREATLSVIRALAQNASVFHQAA